ncbi:MAG TPA: DNA-3-methyladenine glycosylase [Actinomycetota bacterium]|nr:DNA-3-methyladenine glycosylase [Actinomycetota bacterium]
MRPLSRRFFARPSPIVAPDLLGRLLVRRLDGETLVARVVETEAYQQDDPASHSFRGRTARTAVMFGPAGHLYVYFTYGMHYCMNVVTGRVGEGSAVLFRAAEPLEGLEAMMARRRMDDPRLLCSGPARLTEALGVGREMNGADLVEGVDLWVAAGRRVPADCVAIGPRVGIRSAVEVPWRFSEAGSAWASRGRAGPPSGGRPGRGTGTDRLRRRTSTP